MVARTARHAVAWYVALGLLAAACGSSDISARETEVALRRDYPGWRSVKCSEGTHGWDYDCTYTVVVAGRPRSVTIGVAVDAEGVTARSAP